MGARTCIIPLSVSSPPPRSETVIVWSRLVTTPGVTAGGPPRPSALPRATIWSPTAIDDEFPSGMVGSPETPDMWIRATSSVGSTPMTVAWYVGPVPLTWAEMLVAPLTTWLLVSTSPDDVRIMPVAWPCPWPPRVTLMSTTAGSTREAMVTGSRAAPDPEPGADGGGAPGRGASDGIAPDLVGSDNVVDVDGDRRVASVTPAPTAAPMTMRSTIAAAVRPRRRAGGGGGGGNTGDSWVPDGGGCPESPGSPTGPG